MKVSWKTNNCGKKYDLDVDITEVVNESQEVILNFVSERIQEDFDKKIDWEIIDMDI